MPQLTTDLAHALCVWTTCQRRVVGLAADFADSGEWALTGAATASAWIASEADIEQCTAREWIRVGRALRGLPAIAQAFESDRLSYSKVRILTRVASTRTESDLLTLALHTPAGALRRAIAQWTHCVHDDVELARHQHDERSVVWRNELDGTVTFTARLPPLVAGRLMSVLTTHVMRARPRASGVGEWPTLAQQHADALDALLVDGGGQLVTELILHVRGDGATLDDGSPVPMLALPPTASCSERCTRSTWRRRVN